MSLSTSVFARHLEKLNGLLVTRSVEELTPLVNPEKICDSIRIAIDLKEECLGSQLTQLMEILQPVDVSVESVSESVKSLMDVCLHLNNIATSIDALPPTREGDLLKAFLLDRAKKIETVVPRLNAFLIETSTSLSQV